MIRPDPALPVEEQGEPWLLRACVWAEARGEGEPGQVAVAWVLRNRAEKRGTSIGHEVLRPMQFSSFIMTDPNYPKLLTAHLDDPHMWELIDGRMLTFEDGGYQPDPTLGADHYLNRDALKVQPRWSLPEFGWVATVKIGKHDFGRAD